MSKFDCDICGECKTTDTEDMHSSGEWASYIQWCAQCDTDLQNSNEYEANKGDYLRDQYRDEGVL